MFKESFKYYKSKKNPPLSFDDVLDFHSGIKSNIKIKPLCIKQKEATPHLHNSCKWEVYTILSHPGFIYIKNPFTEQGQRYWIKQSIQEYTKKPNKLNIDIHNLVPPGCDWWVYAQEHKEVLTKLRWATIGYHHNWDTKKYTEEDKNSFPDNLSSLCDHFAQVLGFSNFIAEAGIVNFYHLDSTLSGHTDHSEEYLDAPLFSFSFGNSAIFLLGGLSIDEKPIAVFIHSGDVVIMSKESRLSYHAIPRIVKTDNQVWRMTDDVEDYSNSFQEINKYLEYSRINLNIRQVLKQGQNTLNS